jgi:hypothetical protein
VSALLEDFEDIAIRCDVCGGETLDLVPIGELKVCIEHVSGKKVCCE